MLGSPSNMVSGRVSRFTRIPDTPEMTSTDEEDPDWGLAFPMSFPLTTRDQANAYLEEKGQRTEGECGQRPNNGSPLR